MSAGSPGRRERAAGCVRRGTRSTRPENGYQGPRTARPSLRRHPSRRCHRIGGKLVGMFITTLNTVTESTGNVVKTGGQFR